MLYHPNPNNVSVSECLGVAPVHESVCSRKKYSEEQLFQHIIGWYKEKNIMTVRLKALHEKGGLLEEAKDVLSSWIKIGKGTVKKETMDALNHSKMHFLESEQKLLAELCKTLHYCGQALSQEELLDKMNEMLLEKHSRVAADNEFVPATLKTVRCFLQRQESLQDKVHAAALIDPLRVAQANSKTRENFEDTQIFNMDEMAMNTTKARQKVISAIGKSRLFQEMVEGDNRMPRHLSVALTTCAS
eukprot:scaffold17822_cov59-Attheya_sp.AAC.1